MHILSVLVQTFEYEHRPVLYFYKGIKLTSDGSGKAQAKAIIDAFITDGLLNSDGSSSFIKGQFTN